jgi:hypothetical protein
MRAQPIALAMMFGLPVILASIAGAACGQTNDQAGSARASDPNLVHTIARELTDRRSHARIVRYELAGKVTIKEGAWGTGIDDEAAGGADQLAEKAAVLPPADVSYESFRKLAMDLERGLFRRELDESIWNLQQKQLNPIHEVWLFDGQSLKAHRPLKGNPSLLYSIPQNTPSYRYYAPDRRAFGFRDAYDMPVFFAHGMIENTSKGPPAELQTRLAALNLTAWRQPGAQAGMAKLVHAASSESAWFTLDLEKQCAVTAAEFFASGKRILAYEITHASVDGFWLPGWWRVESYGTEGNLRFVGEFRVTSLELPLAIDDAAFRAQPQAGDVVEIDGKGHFRVDTRRNLVPFNPNLPPDESAGWLAWRWMLAIVNISIIGLVIVWRMRRRRA